MSPRLGHLGPVMSHAHQCSSTNLMQGVFSLPTKSFFLIGFTCVLTLATEGALRQKEALGLRHQEGSEHCIDA